VQDWCKPGDRNFGGVAIRARKRASGVWEEEERVSERPPIADAFAAQDHTREWKKDEEGKKVKDEEGRGGGGVAPALLLTCVIVVVQSVHGSRRPPTPSAPAPVAVVAAFESCKLTMQTERGVGLRPLEKGTGVCC
jgi:hypothetical protein